MKENADRVSTSARLMQIMAERDLRQVDILELAKPYCEQYGVKLTKSGLSQIISGRNEPKQDKIYVLSLALNVSEAWLMGYDVPRERPADSSHDGLDPKRQAIIEMTGKLSESQKDVVLALLRSYVEGQQ